MRRPPSGKRIWNRIRSGTAIRKAPATPASPEAAMKEGACCVPAGGAAANAQAAQARAPQAAGASLPSTQVAPVAPATPTTPTAPTLLLVEGGAFRMGTDSAEGFAEDGEGP